MSPSTLIQTPDVSYEQPLGLFINNKFVKGVEGKIFQTINPSTEKLITSVHEDTEKDVDVAVRAARAAFGGECHNVTPSERGRLLVIERDSETLAARLYAAKLIVEAGFPAGVVNIISGFGHTAGAAILSRMDIDKVAFTGSTFAGRLYHGPPVEFSRDRL